jgi:ubiquinone biosynthesis protein COQ9
VDAIWHAAGDRSADFSWYTKRAILAAVYSATVLYWLRDASEEDEATLAFLDRRLAGVGRIGRLRGRAEAALARVPRPRMPFGIPRGVGDTG